MRFHFSVGPSSRSAHTLNVGPTGQEVVGTPPGFPGRSPHIKFIWWILYWSFWTTIGLLNAATQTIQTPDIPKWKPLLWELSSLYTVGLIYPLVAIAARRFPFSKQTWARALPA